MKNLYVFISLLTILMVSAFIGYDSLYLRQNAIYKIIEDTKSDNLIDTLVAQARASTIHLSAYDFGPSLGPSCEKIRFCFDHEIFDHADEVFAFAPRSLPFEVGRVLQKCDHDECHWIEKFSVYIEPISYSERNVALNAQSLKDLGCKTYNYQFYSGRYCRQDTISEGKMVETLIFTQVEKPISYGFLMFDQHFTSTGSWRINFLTGEVKTSGAATQ